MKATKGKNRYQELIEYVGVNGNGETSMQAVNEVFLFAWLLASLSSTEGGLLALCNTSDLLLLDLEVLSEFTGSRRLALETHL